ncbi:MAG: glycogen synthase GlgA [Planctomycetes bacterium]|nr:glycogen synthase GlgA [Planctomycetota bacterium]
MNILVATSEAVPFAKTGGLGDVSGALPIALAELGEQVSVIMPAFRSVKQCGEPLEPTGLELDIPIGKKTVRGSLLKGRLPGNGVPGNGVPVYFVEQDEYFDRPELYGEDGQDYKDNCERFVFFSRAVIEAIRLLDLKIDLLHANDWQTGLLPAYLKTEFSGVPPYEQIATLFTIHNLAYQGNFWHWDMLLTGLDWKYFNWHQMEFHGNLNLMKTGLAFADAINTVSPRYAEEIQSAPLGCGLEGILQHRREVLSGIINGVSYETWNPATDTHLATNYGPETAEAGKAACKAALQQEMGLPVNAQVPLLGFVGRLVEQKGIDLIAGVMQQWAETSEAQWVLLGTGEPKYHELLKQLAERFPTKVAVQLAYSDPLAHRIEAGCDLFLMPSRYEPCGLNQLYSLKYGTIPVVRATGGLADTIVNTNDATLASGEANGFCFHDYSQLALSEALTRALAAYADKQVWSRLVQNAMRQDWSWSRSAQQYVQLYQQTIERVKQEVCM